MEDLAAFHSREKYLLLAHNPMTYQSLGQFVAAAKSIPRDRIEREYLAMFMTGLSKSADSGRHANVLQHILGYFKRCLDVGDRHELAALIEDYQRGVIPLVVPMTLLRHHVRRNGIGYLAMQTYLDPYPSDLMLRNYV